MDKNILKNRLIKLLNEFIEENEVELNENLIIDEKTRLIGTSSIFDSMELVQFIVEVESILEEDFNFEIELTSEKAMSRRNSPFISLNSLTDYITNESK